MDMKKLIIIVMSGMLLLVLPAFATSVYTDLPSCYSYCDSDYTSCRYEASEAYCYPFLISCRTDCESYFGDAGTFCSDLGYTNITCSICPSCSCNCPTCETSTVCPTCSVCPTSHTFSVLSGDLSSGNYNGAINEIFFGEFPWWLIILLSITTLSKNKKLQDIRRKIPW